MAISLEDIGEAINAELEQKTVFQCLAVRYLLDHPGVHIITEEQAEELSQYGIGFNYVKGTTVEAQLFSRYKQTHEAPLKLVEPDDTEQTIEQFFEAYPPLQGKIDE